MASGGVGSNTFYNGRIEHSIKSYGFIRMDKNAPVPRIFFDRSSINGAAGDLSELFPKGSRIRTRIVPTDGEHKVKFKAKNLQLFQTHQDEKVKSGGDQFLKNYLKDGAILLDKLADELSKSRRNCPKSLRNGGKEEISAVVSARPDWFMLKNNFVCLKEPEDDLLREIMEEMDTYDNKIPFAAMTAIIPPENSHRKYLHSTQKWNIGVKDFVSRNTSKFLYHDEYIWNRKYLNSNVALQQVQTDLLAVYFYSQFVDGDVSIKSLSGHFNQACHEVKEASRPNEPQFRKFLERNTFFFTIEGNKVKECLPHRLSCINDWFTKKSRVLAASFTKPSPPVPLPRQSSGPQLSQNNAGSQSSRRRSEPKSPSIPPLMAQSAQPPMPYYRSPVQVSKAFSDAEMENVYPKKTSKKHEYPVESFSDLTFGTTPISPVSSSSVEFYNSYPHQAAAAFSQPNQSRACAPETEGPLYSTPDAALFKDLIGNELSRAIQDEILADDTLNSLILLRLNVGKPPIAIFKIPGEKNGLKHDLNLDPCKADDLQRILRHNKVVKSNEVNNRYCVRGTLHSILTRESGNKVTGLTLFCQLHEQSDGFDMEVREWRNFTAVFSGNYPDKHMYNYLRSRSASLSKSEDVLIIDVDGQLSGCDEAPHPSLGSVTKISCASSSELGNLITESIQHMHGYVITISVDATEHLKAIQKMCDQGTQVLAAVSSILKSEAESMFS